MRKRFLFILSSCIALFLLAQCTEECPECGCGGTFINNAIELSSVSAWFQGDSTNGVIALEPELLYAHYQKEHSFALFPTAYACQPAEEITPLDNLVDSILIFSYPEYSRSKMEEIVHFEMNHLATSSIHSYNQMIERNFNISGYPFLIITEKPLQSDSFVFSFYFFKGGALIDTCSTQPFYLSE